MAKDPALPAGQLRVVVVTPETTLVDDTATFIALPLFDGEIGIAPLHSPMIGRLGFGEMRIEQGSDVRRLYVDGGFVQVVGDVVSVLTNRAVDVRDLNVAAAEEQLRSANAMKADTDELLAIRERQVAQARGQLSAVRHAR
jgi:F-type H+-transporting ATPase subunit epsilon